MTGTVRWHRIWFVAAAAAVATSLACFVAGVAAWAGSMAGILSLICIFLAWYSVSKPLHSVHQGICLLAEQDYASRLRHVGEPVADRVVDFYNDLIDNMKSERVKLKEQNSFLDQVINASPAGIAICNLDKSIRTSNPAFKQLYNSDVQTSIDKLNPGQSAICRAGHDQIVKCSVMSFMDSGFHRNFIMVERMTDEILAAEQNIFSKIIRIMSHEVNNSLVSPRSVLETLSELHRSDPMITKAISSSIRACDNLGVFTHRFAQAVKLPVPRLEALDMNHWLNEIGPVLLGLTEGIELKIETDNELCLIQGDSILLERLIINIVKNAAESIRSGDRPQEGRIVIRIHGNRLEISDNGPGLSQEITGKLFEPFFTTKPTGHGLGLMLCASILRSHNAGYSLTTTRTADKPQTTFAITFQQVRGGTG